MLKPRRISFLTRPGCGLCHQALPRLERVARWFPVELVVVDITANPEMEDNYHLRIPVVLGRNGRVLAEGHIGQLQALKACASALF